MAAVKVVNQFMVKQLLKKSVDIAACDNEGEESSQNGWCCTALSSLLSLTHTRSNVCAHNTTHTHTGRTAVHWAAVLGNLEALQLLIRQGPDKLKDFQDNKVP